MHHRLAGSLCIGLLLVSCRETVVNHPSVATKSERYQTVSELVFAPDAYNNISGLKETLDGNYLLFVGRGVGHVIKLSPQGDSLYTQAVQLEHAFTDWVELPDCFYVITTDARTMGGYTTDFLEKYDKNWKRLWSKHIDKPKYPAGNAVLAVTEQQQLLFIADDAQMNERNSQRLAIRRYNLAGKMLVSHLYAKNSLNNPVSLLKTYDHNFLLTATTSDSRQTDLWMLLLDQNGDTLWTKSYQNFYPRQTLQLKDSSLLFMGLAMTLLIPVVIIF